MNVFRPVDDSTVLPDRIIQGQPWRNISFGKNAAIKSYQDKGLYLEVGSKPVHDQYSEAVVTAETIDHTTKTVVLTWEVQPLSAERIAEIVRVEEHEAEHVSMKKVTLKNKTDWVKARLHATTLDAKTKVELGKIFKKIVST